MELQLNDFVFVIQVQSPSVRSVETGFFSHFRGLFRTVC